MTIDKKVIEAIFEKGRTYYHCAWHGMIYLDKFYKIPLINLKKLTGKTEIPKELSDYLITSGICDDCYEEFKR